MHYEQPLHAINTSGRKGGKKGIYINDYVSVVRLRSEWVKDFLECLGEMYEKG